MLPGTPSGPARHVIAESHSTLHMPICRILRDQIGAAGSKKAGHTPEAECWNPAGGTWSVYESWCEVKEYEACAFRTFGHTSLLACRNLR